MNDFFKEAAAKYDDEEERRLIAMVQQDPNNALAWRKLKIRFRPLIQSIINKNHQGNVPTETLMATADERFESLIKNYDPNKGIKPSTYLTTSISFAIKDENKAGQQMETRMPSNISDIIQKKHLAETDLKSQGILNPTPEQISENIKTVFGTGSKMYQPERIMQANKYTRKTLSANKLVGQEGVGENLTQGDLSFVKGPDADEYFRRQNLKSKYDQLMNRMDKHDQEFISRALSLGKYSGKEPENLGRLAFDFNLGSPYFAQKKLDSLQEQLRKWGAGNDF